jgi:2-polyprenyl-3-methyl-5-hydroxy-6-metoxy-1,4-benzoquinol methylase
MQVCLVCKSSSGRLIYKKSLKKCKACGFITANMEIDEKELFSIYNRNYFKGEEYLDYLRDKAVLQKNFSKRLDSLEIGEDPTVMVNALEIGCAYGFYGELFTARFKNSRFTGIDIVEEAIEHGRNNLELDLILGDYLKYYSPEVYSHVFMWDVIEHLSRPDLFIEKIARETRKGSELHITTGDIGAFLPRIQKQKWRMVHPPTHLHYFSGKTLTLLLEKNGFKVKKLMYKPVYRSVRQIFYSLFLLNRSNSDFRNQLFQRIPGNLFFPLNTYDIMHCVAVKE